MQCKGGTAYRAQHAGAWVRAAAQDPPHCISSCNDCKASKQASKAATNQRMGATCLPRATSPISIHPPTCTVAHTAPQSYLQGVGACLQRLQPAGLAAHLRIIQLRQLLLPPHLLSQPLHLDQHLCERERGMCINLLCVRSYAQHGAWVPASRVETGYNICMWFRCRVHSLQLHHVFSVAHAVLQGVAFAMQCLGLVGKKQYELHSPASTIIPLGTQPGHKPNILANPQITPTLSKPLSEGRLSHANQ